LQGLFLEINFEWQENRPRQSRQKKLISWFKDCATLAAEGSFSLAGRTNQSPYPTIRTGFIRTLALFVNQSIIIDYPPSGQADMLSPTE
jgi:hypothetical protein